MLKRISEGGVVPFGISWSYWTIPIHNKPERHWKQFKIYVSWAKYRMISIGFELAGK
jgi:hypothetical protein